MVQASLESWRLCYSFSFIFSSGSSLLGPSYRESYAAQYLASVPLWYFYICVHNTLNVVSLMQNQYHMGNTAKICCRLEIHPGSSGPWFQWLLCVFKAELKEHFPGWLFWSRDPLSQYHSVQALSLRWRCSFTGWNLSWLGLAPRNLPIVSVQNTGLFQ